MTRLQAMMLKMAGQNPLTTTKPQTGTNDSDDEEMEYDGEDGSGRQSRPPGPPPG